MIISPKNIAPTDLSFLYKKNYGRRAGIVPFMIDRRGETYILLGQDKQNGRWADLGGRSEKNETPLENAMREYLEESRGVFPIDLSSLTRVVISKHRKGLQTILFVQVLSSEDNIKIDEKFQNTIPKNKYEDELSYLKWIHFDEFMNAENKQLSRAMGMTRKTLYKFI